MDIFGNIKLVQICCNEWWYNGRVIVNQTDCRLPSWISFQDNKNSLIKIHNSKKEAINYCIENPCKNPLNTAQSYM